VRTKGRDEGENNSSCYRISTLTRMKVPLEVYDVVIIKNKLRNNEKITVKLVKTEKRSKKMRRLLWNPIDDDVENSP